MVCEEDTVHVPFYSLPQRFNFSISILIYNLYIPSAKYNLRLQQRAHLLEDHEHRSRNLVYEGEKKPTKTWVNTIAVFTLKCGIQPFFFQFGEFVGVGLALHWVNKINILVKVFWGMRK